jgi:Reverse transcriptase (RNA-dependent DNA polymerase)
MKAGWWVPTNTRQAIPMLSIPKKNGTLRTVFDMRLQNENTVKDLTPFPDQDIIWNDIARAPICSKLDMSEAYKQTRINPEDVQKTAFATIYGTFVSHVMMMGDCNAPSTFQRLMTTIFHDLIGRYVHIYLDDIFIFSNTIEEHQEHLREIFLRLQKAHLFLSKSKAEIYAEAMDCLGHIIDDHGIHACMDKMAKIREQRRP